MKVGERALKPGAVCREIDAEVRGRFAAHSLAGNFPHHTGHGLGLAHPEPPYLVPESDDSLLVGDVVTVEPALFVNGRRAVFSQWPRNERSFLGCLRVTCNSEREWQSSRLEKITCSILTCALPNLEGRGLG